MENQWVLHQNPKIFGRYLVNSETYGVCIEKFAADYHWWYGSKLEFDSTVIGWMPLPEAIVENNYICPRCKESIKKEFHYCPWCGMKFDSTN